MVAYPVAVEGGKSMAANIAAEWITREHKILPLVFPMVAEVEPRKSAWHKASDQLANEVLDGERVVFLCQGDVSLFSSSCYIFLDFKNRYPSIPFHLLPGVTSISAAAALGVWPLALQHEQLLVVPTPDKVEDLESLLLEAKKKQRVLVLLKLGHRWSWVRPLLKELDLLEKALFAQRLGWPDQELALASCVSAEERSYFSLLLVRQSWPNVMP